MGTETRHLTRGATPPLLVLPAALCLALAACTVGPNYKTPEVDAPPAWSAASSAGGGDLASVPVARAFDGKRWWSVFHDPLLDRLVDEAARQNLDVQTAALRIKEARAQRDSAAGAELPTVGVSGLGGRSRMSPNGIASALSGGSSSGSSSSSSSSSSAPSLTTDLYQVGFDAVWELDLWGKTRRNVEAAQAMTVSAEQARGDAAVSLTAEVVRNYLSMRGLQRQLGVERADVVDQQRLLDLVESSARNGLVPRSDVAQQATQLAAARAQIPPLEQNIEQSANALALLLAQPPGALRGRLGDTAPDTTPLPPEVPIGLPGDLLRRRPDVLRSEAELHAATARIGVARAQLFPSVELGAVAGLQSTSSGSLLNWASRFFAGGAQVSVPLFQGGRLTAQVRVADVQMQEAALDFRKTVLSAYREADDALIGYAQEQRHASALAEQLAQAQRSRDLAQARYRNGLAPLIDVLQSQHAAHQAELSSLQSTVTASTNLVALFKALGGDWSETAASAQDLTGRGGPPPGAG